MTGDGGAEHRSAAESQLAVLRGSRQEETPGGRLGGAREPLRPEERLPCLEIRRIETRARDEPGKVDDASDGTCCAARRGEERGGVVPGAYPDAGTQLRSRT